MALKMRCGQKRGVKVVNFQGDFFSCFGYYEASFSPRIKFRVPKEPQFLIVCKKCTKFDIAHFFMLENWRLSAISWILTFRKNEPKKAV